MINQLLQNLRYLQLGVGNSGSSSLVNEIGIVSSRRLMENVVEALNLNIRYTVEVNLKDVELYSVSDLKVNVITLQNDSLSKLARDSRKFKLKIDNGNRVSFTNLNNNTVVQGSLNTPLDLGFAKVIVSLRDINKEPVPHQLDVEFIPVVLLANDLRSKLSIMPWEKTSSLLEITMSDNVPQKAQDIFKPTHG